MINYVIIRDFTINVMFLIVQQVIFSFSFLSETHIIDIHTYIYAYIFIYFNVNYIPVILDFMQIDM